MKAKLFSVLILLFSFKSQGQLIEGLILGLIIGDVKNDEELYSSFVENDTSIVSNNLNKSYQEVTAAIGKNRTNPKLYLKRALVKRKSGQNAAAMLDFEKAYDLGKEQHYPPTFLDSISLEKCITSVATGKRGVEKCFDSYLIKHENNKKALFYKALYFYCFDVEKKEKRFTHAIQGFNDVLEVDPTNLDAKLFIAYSYFRLKDYPNALKANTEIINEYPRCGTAYFQRGKVFLEINDSQKACSDFESAKNLNIGATKALLRDYCK